MSATTGPLGLPGRLARFAPWVRERSAALHPGPWNRSALTLVAITLVLVVLGLVMSFSASVVTAAEQGNAFDEFQRQLLWAGLGVPVFFITAAVHVHWWRRVAKWLMLLALAALFAVLMVGVGAAETGSDRWLQLGPLRAQPSELAKLATVLFLADVMARKKASFGPRLPLAHLLVPALPLLGLQAVLLMMEPDLGTTLLMAAIVFLVLFIEGLELRWIGLGAVVTAFGGLALASTAAYRMDRIRGWLEAEADPMGAGWQLIQSLTALGSGGWLGTGLGTGRGKWNYVPNPHTDFIFAVIGEELGLLGAMATLSLFAVIAGIGLGVAARTTDPFSRTVAFVIAGWVTGQAILNVMTVVGLLPITGVTLPLVSAGGSSLVTTLVSLAILVSIARSSTAEPDAS
ncbi:MAG: putative lipid II flippase FtsW [Nitriliruptorales bacterium]|nr:putative lipid II flippase FtsW [Nitriliruptorales bacterium]